MSNGKDQELAGYNMESITPPVASYKLRRIHHKPWLKKGMKNLPLALVEGGIMATTGAIIGVLIPGIPLLIMGEASGIFLGMEIGAILFGITSFLSGLVLGLPPPQR